MRASSPISATTSPTRVAHEMASTPPQESIQPSPPADIQTEALSQRAPRPGSQRSGRLQTGGSPTAEGATPSTASSSVPEIRLWIGSQDPDRAATLPVAGRLQEQPEPSSRSDVASLSQLQRPASTQASGASRSQPPPALQRRAFVNQLRIYLNEYPATADTDDAPETQEQLEEEYVEWAADRLQQRHEAYGPNGGYRFNENMSAAGTAAALPAAYETLKGFLSSALRTPPGSATATKYDQQDGSLTTKVGPTAVGGATSGITSYFTEQILLSAIERRARLANMPAFKPIAPSILSPEPGPVQMEITAEGNKHFWRPLRDEEVSHLEHEGDRPTFGKLQSIARDRQRQLLERQKLMDGKAEATFLKPVLSGTLNGVRRSLSSTATLLSPPLVLGTSMIGSGTSGALGKAILETGKALPRVGQTQVDNLVGGTQTVNLFRLARHDESAPALRWSDARRLHHTLVEIAQEAGALATLPFTSPLMAVRSVRDLLLRHMGGNILTSWVATGGGMVLASLVRGSYGTPGTNESLSSPGSVVQQFGQSFSNDAVWNATNSALSDTKHDLAVNLDGHRDNKQARLRSRALTIQAGLQPEIDLIRNAAEQTQNARLQQVAAALEQSLQHGTGVLERSRFETALATIGQVLDAPDGIEQQTLNRLRTLQDQVTDVRGLLMQRQALLDWRNGRPRTST
ncbi:type III secretion system effector protein [Xanthomonas cerealis pv. cerealis]|uniref:Type III secretion system effector protein n=1 Tax=Xanthomonas cerealis pv. cerealis TaxID=152263 RepID=A0A514E9I8_9XANT|nr:type III secretion system effector XopF2 [Xanthomonas translucens]QDI02681.1 type III secretion system effector protein [Xanthomonas translucens pv. cerealis]